MQIMEAERIEEESIRVNQGNIAMQIDEAIKLKEKHARQAKLKEMLDQGINWAFELLISFCQIILTVYYKKIRGLVCLKCNWKKNEIWQRLSHKKTTTAKKLIETVAFIPDFLFS